MLCQLRFCLNWALQTLISTQMIDGNTSYQNYATRREQRGGGDRLPLGAAMLAVAGLSVLAWAVMLLPLVAIFDI